MLTCRRWAVFLELLENAHNHTTPPHTTRSLLSLLHMRNLAGPILSCQAAARDSHPGVCWSAFPGLHQLAAGHVDSLGRIPPPNALWCDRFQYIDEGLRDPGPQDLDHRVLRMVLSRPQIRTLYMTVMGANHAKLRSVTSNASFTGPTFFLPGRTLRGWPPCGSLPGGRPGHFGP